MRCPYFWQLELGFSKADDLIEYATRDPGRSLGPGEVIPHEVSLFLAAQLGLKADDLIEYAKREVPAPFPFAGQIAPMIICPRFGQFMAIAHSRAGLPVI